MRTTTLALALFALGAGSLAFAQVGEEEEPILMIRGPERGAPKLEPTPPAVRTKGVQPPVEEEEAAAPVTLEGRAMVCAPGKTCTMPCPTGRCAVDCAPGSRCTATCAGGECVQRCGQGATCTFTCTGGKCAQACFSAQCTPSCAGDACLLKQVVKPQPGTKKRR